MSRFVEITLWLSYPLVIFVCVLWSSTTVEKTLYNRFIIYPEGLILPSEDIEASQTFYSEILDLPAITPAGRFEKLSEHSIKLAEQHTIFLQKSSSEDRSPIILIRVRNGFHDLHRELLLRFRSDAQTLDETNALTDIRPGSVSTIFRGSLGDQFIARDPSGNKILFYQKRLRLF